ncbi:MAG: ATP-binding protein [Myxococcales bacterium]|nr:ATP-binding protein [Myxococcales bacterium]
MSTPDLPRAADLPAWMKRLRDRYLQTETGQFILHGNVHDVVMSGGRVWNMPAFLDAFFAPSGKVVVHYDPGRGVWLPDEAHAARAALSLVASGFVSEAKVAPRGLDKTPKAMLARNLAEQLGTEREPEIALQALEALLLDREIPTAAIIHYAELVAPDGSPSTMSFFDRTAAARLHRWSLSDEILRGDNLVLMLTGALSDLARRVTRNPRVGALHVPLPGSLERARFLAHIKPGLDPDRGETLTRVTAGLQLRQIQDLVAPKTPTDTISAPPSADGDARSVFQGAAPLPTGGIAARKKEILEQECFGLIEVIEPDHDFSHVGGMEPIKRVLTRVAGHVRDGRRAQVPMGILFVGPMGTGKSFLAEAFAKESGLAAVKLKNFRDKWVGSTEANLEKVLDVIEGLGEILVMIDEGDRSIGGGDGGGDSGVNSRVMARLKEFMSDPTHRGRIIFVMMTNRPDKLDTDMKRPGRFDLKIPFFSPQSAAERAAIVQAVIRRHRLPADLPDDALLPILEDLDGYAAADLEALVLLAYDDLQSGDLPEGLTEAPQGITAPFLARAAADFMPTRETDMIRYMELLAVHEASNRRLLPERLRDIEVAELTAQLADARATLARQKALF